MRAPRITGRHAAAAAPARRSGPSRPTSLSAHQGAVGRGPRGASLRDKDKAKCSAPCFLVLLTPAGPAAA